MTKTKIKIMQILGSSNHARLERHGFGNHVRHKRRWCFLCSVLLLLLNQIGRRIGKEEGTKLTEKRTESRWREEDNKESIKFYGMINGEKIIWFAFVCS
jgi:hypothetical protein